MLAGVDTFAKASELTEVEALRLNNLDRCGAILRAVLSQHGYALRAD